MAWDVRLRRCRTRDSRRGRPGLRRLMASYGRPALRRRERRVGTSHSGFPGTNATELGNPIDWLLLHGPRQGTDPALLPSGPGTGANPGAEPAVRHLSKPPGLDEMVFGR